ncbi:NADH-quinone oxidoreductase subunit NuoB [candidate division WOR-3 bacterium]|nr:NADH-quinone oxidoreductase subunit NuoB [candidate division WOR-3 bacterium]
MDILKKSFKKSIWVFHLSSAACNNCDIEVLELLTPRYDIERFGMKLVASPRHADALLVCGAINAHAKPRLLEVYRQTAKPCLVVAFGSCGCSAGIFRDSYSIIGPIDKILKEVDPDVKIVYIPGCPPKPEAMIAGIVKGLGAI